MQLYNIIYCCLFTDERSDTMKSLFGNVVKIKEKTNNIIVVRFAIDKHLQYKDANTGKYELGTLFIDLKFFNRLFDKFHQSEITSGSRLKIIDYDIALWADDYNPKNPKVTDLSYLVNDFEKIAKSTNLSLEEKPKSKIMLNKPIAQHKVDSHSNEDEGNPDWMNE